MQEKSSTFAVDMRKGLLYIIIGAMAMVSCGRPSRVEQYKAEKRARDSVRLEEQVRSLAYYEGELERLMPVADSLIALFRYEKNDKYQDHGYYVVESRKSKVESLRILVRDDGSEILYYRNGKRVAYPDPSLKGRDKEALDRAEHLQVTIKDIKELEKRIVKTSLEVQKYQKRLQIN
jgi:hypothetical protein